VNEAATARPTANGKVLAGLLGRDIQSSRSPWLHEREAAAQGLRLLYSLFDFTVLARGDGDLGRFVDAARLLGFAGLNVTFPFKQAVIPLIDSLAPTAARLGAVNTIQFSGGKAIGHNTDVTGFSESLKTALSAADLSCVAQFGAGGAGSATAHGLLDVGVGKLLLVDRDLAKRDALVASLRDHFGADRAEAIDDPAIAVPAATGIVNSTPVGMARYPGTPFDTALLRADQWVADIVYFPLETALLRDARAIGCATLDGSGMNILQAATAFEIFTGLTANRERLRKSFAEFAATPVSQAA
jgi:shikimate dehydrogenase